ncbi:unnamed protein product [Somion occarium]|uniref:Galactokinase n=1 Tax=Somion occarium TaxID=3059160 RepID=A0ABP1EC18_9APHY
MAADLPVPVYTSLSDVYPDLLLAAKHGARFNDLASEFESRFGSQPAYIARAPGRVNLIGEHIDYALFGVFPAAIEQDILIACGPRSSSPTTPEPSSPGTVTAQNTFPKYTPQTFTPMLRVVSQAQDQAQDEMLDKDVRVQDWHLDIDKSQLRWESYVKAGYYGVLNRFFTSSDEYPVPVNILVSGNVPAGSGLSSSAAMVVASTLAFLAVNHKLDGVKKGALVQMAVENEKRVGVNSGGMDQAASILSTPNSALYITFYPSLSAELVSLPQATKAGEGVVLVCANSLVVSDKVVGAKTRYNLRVVETLVAARVLSRKLNLTLPPSSTSNKPPTLREVLSAYIGRPEPIAADALKEGLERILAEIHVLKASALRGEIGIVGNEDEDEGVTMEEMISASGLGEDEFKRIYLSWVDVEATRFQLYKRTKHILTEALRVLQFRELCLASTTHSISILPTTTSTSSSSPPSSSTSSSSTSTEAFKALGALMNASHDSCSRLYECSCPELDELTQIARESGAYGSRLTGKVHCLSRVSFSMSRFLLFSIFFVFLSLCMHLTELTSKPILLISSLLFQLSTFTIKSNPLALYQLSPGAGWGGCSVSLVPESQVDTFIAKVRSRYPKFRGLEGDALNEVIFATKPGVGAFGRFPLAYSFLDCGGEIFTDMCHHFL